MVLSIFLAVTGISLTRWIDPLGRGPVDFKTWSSVHKSYNTKVTTILTTNKGRGLVDVVVNGGIYIEIKDEITRFISDLTSEGYQVQLDTTTNITAPALRDHLGSLPGLEGAILVGEMPLAWFEDDEFGSWEEFPIDLYFADLDGNWIDQDSDGLFDNHTGDVQPEIWIGRIYAPPLQYLDEITLYRRYFDKNHAYRTGGLPLPHRALSFVDDDWFYWTTCYTDLVYSNVTVVNNKYQTTAANYRNHLKNGYEWIHLCSHSSPWGHTFMIPNGPYAGTVFNYEIFYLEPDAHFLNLFACSGTRFVEENNVGNWYIFHSDNGLTVIGSTKTGSMLYFDDFYRPLGQGKNIGNAFKEWFILNGELSWGWFYGLNILGDPTLKPMMSDGEVARFESFDGFTEVIAPDPESDGNLFCAMVGDTIWVVWESGRSQSNGRCDILSAYRTTNWSDAIPVGPQVYWDYAPTITHTQDGQPIAIWSAFKGSAYHYNLYYSLFSGTSWSNPVIIDSDPSYDFRARAVTDNAGKVWLFFQSRRDVNSNIYYATYTTSWSTPQRVTDTPEDELSPQPLVDYSGRVWVFYHRQDPTGSRIYASYYDNGWHELGPISKGQTRAYHPIGAASDDKIWLVWHTFDQGPGDIYYSYYDGNNWTDPLPVTTDPGEDLLPSITVDQGGSPWVSWQSDRDGTWQIYTSYYKGGWQSPEKISDNLAAINSGTVTDNNNQIWFLWQGYDDNWEIYADYRCGTGVGEVTKGKAEEPKLKSLYRIGDDIRIDKDFALIDASGRMVKKGKGVINTRGLPPGIFFLKVIDSIKKVILVR